MMVQGIAFGSKRGICYTDHCCFWDDESIGLEQGLSTGRVQIVFNLRFDILIIGLIPDRYAILGVAITQVRSLYSKEMLEQQGDVYHPSQKIPRNAKFSWRPPPYFLSSCSHGINFFLNCVFNGSNRLCKSDWVIIKVTAINTSVIWVRVSIQMTLRGLKWLKWSQFSLILNPIIRTVPILN
jgi:hypothetical protein